MNTFKRKYLHGAVLAGLSAIGAFGMHMTDEVPANVVKTKEQNEAEKAAAEKLKAEALAVKLSEIKALHNNLVDIVESTFRFKTVKQLDDQGKETGVETKRPDIELYLPVPSLEGLIAAMTVQGSPEYNLVMEAIQNIVADRARDIVNDNESVTSENFPYEQLSWTTIATLPKSERRGGGIPAETWKEFGIDYVAVMPAATGKTAELVQRAATLLVNKLNACKSNKAVLAKLQTQLAIYLEATPRKEEFAKCVEFLDKKADALLKIDESKMADLI